MNWKDYIVVMADFKVFSKNFHGEIVENHGNLRRDIRVYSWYIYNTSRRANKSCIFFMTNYYENFQNFTLSSTFIFHLRS
jgi:hypothetical protein